jgi:N-carbamoylputrescine amidase
MVKIGLIQARAVESRHVNFENTCKKIEKAADEGVQIVCTQELFRSLYFCQKEDHSFFNLAEELHPDSVTIGTLSAIAKKREIVIIASLFEKRAEGLYHNTAVVIDADGTYLGKYRKMHIPDDPHYYEKFYFTEGDLGYQAFKTRFGTIGVLICWDQWYPEAARLTALRGAQILFYPTAIGWFPRDKEGIGKAHYRAWETIQRSHAVANGCFVAAVNRVGFEAEPEGESGIEFWGQSFIADPFGDIVSQGSPDHEELVTASIDLGRVETTRQEWPFFRDRRITSYSDITKRFID